MIPSVTGFAVYVWPRGARKAKATGEVLVINEIPDSWSYEGTTYKHRTWLDNVDRVIVFSEVDPRLSA